MITIYHNPRCKKSRAGLQALESFTKDFNIKLYLKDDPFTKASLNEALKKLGKKPEEIIRKQETIYKTNYKGKTLSDEEWINILLEHPKLIQRPIIIKDNKAVLGDPAENVDALFK
ncbi:MAG: arsenate reductase (glutaredoxin) [Bacteroidales bacterium]|nr:arsenate reductase (glutaredoxin) [Bacteroidales bacterium]